VFLFVCAGMRENEKDQRTGVWGLGKERTTRTPPHPHGAACVLAGSLLSAVYCLLLAVRSRELLELCRLLEQRVLRA
jgi:hypothetical protein